MASGNPQLRALRLLLAATYALSRETKRGGCGDCAAGTRLQRRTRLYPVQLRRVCTLQTAAATARNTFRGEKRTHLWNISTLTLDTLSPVAYNEWRRRKISGL